MPTLWSFVKAPFRPRDPDDRDLAGEDVALVKGVVPLAPSGSWATVSREAAARQSVIREAGANAGALVRRPEWGMGLPGRLFRGVNRDLRDDVTARATRRMAANPRVSSVQEIKTTELDADIGAGLGIDLRFTSGGRPVAMFTVLAPKGG